MNRIGQLEVVTNELVVPEVSGAIDPYLNNGVQGQAMIDARSNANRFTENAMDIYSTKLKGEDVTKRMYIAGLIMGAENGMMVGVFGHPGGGKSLITENGVTIVDGIGREDIAVVPHRQDLSPAKLTGETSKMSKTTIKDGKEVTEDIVAKVVPIIRPGIKAIQFDEVNRTSPLAMNAVLKIAQDGRVEAVNENGSVTQVNDIDLISIAANNYGTAFTNKLDPAIIARTGMGAFMNERPKDGLTEGAKFRWGNPSGMFHAGPFEQKAIKLDTLHTIREAVPYVAMESPEQELGMRIESQALNHLAENNIIKLADTRSADQIIRISQALTLMDNQPKVGEQQLREAFVYWMTAKLAMTGAIESNAESQTLVDSFN
jgi:hypothetical protein